MNDLVKYLESLQTGSISDTSELERLLAICWDQFEGDYGGMEDYKLLGRMEDVTWDPHTHILTFKIERHGGTVMGSSRAEIQRWKVDVNKMTVGHEISGHRRRVPARCSMPLLGSV